MISDKGRGEIFTDTRRTSKGEKAGSFLGWSAEQDQDADHKEVSFPHCISNIYLSAN